MSTYRSTLTRAFRETADSMEAMQILIEAGIPVSDSSGESKPLGKHLLDLVEYALAHAIEPQVLNGESRSFWLTRESEARLLTLVPRREGEPDRAWIDRAGALANAAAEVIRQKMSDVRKARYGNDLSNAQVSMLKYIDDAVTTGRIALIEGATGIGKSRLIAVAARQALATTDKSVVIAVPTFQILGQVAREWAALEGRDPQIDACVRVGRGQFVNPDRLKQMLDNGEIPDPLADRLRQWHDNGGRMDADTAAHDSWSQSLGVETRWLWDDIADLVAEYQMEKGEAPFSRAALLLQSGDAPCEAEAVWARINEASRESRLVLTTHASLVMDALVRRFGSTGLVPALEGGVLLLDEAHNIWSVAANILGGVIAPHYLQMVLKRRIDSNSMPRGMKTKYKKAWSCMRRWRDHFRTNNVSLAGNRYDLPRRPGLGDDNAGVGVKVVQMIDEMIDVLTPLAEKDEAMAGALDVLKNAVESGPDGRDYNVTLILSPRRGYASLQIESFRPEYPLRKIWSVAGSAALLSGTLYIQQSGHALSDEWIRKTLSLPHDRLLLAPPYEAAWARKATTLHYPVGKARNELLPPISHEGQTDEEIKAAEARWLDRVAEQIRFVVAGAQGGVLVLLTAYRYVDGLAQRLEALGERLLVQQRGLGTLPYVKRFKAMAAKGGRPVWLATGPAWTGLDLTDSEVAPEEDRLLTDLVIPRAPVADNGSAAARYHSIERRRCESQVRLRQALGRLVRRDGVRDRHLWVLDGRYWGTRNRVINGGEVVLRQYTSETFGRLGGTEAPADPVEEPTVAPADPAPPGSDYRPPAGLLDMWL